MFLCCFFVQLLRNQGHQPGFKVTFRVWLFSVFALKLHSF